MAKKKPKVKEVVISGDIADGIVVLALKQMRDILEKDIDRIYTIPEPTPGQLADAGYSVKTLNHINGVLEFYGN